MQVLAVKGDLLALAHVDFDLDEDKVLLFDVSDKDKQVWAVRRAPAPPTRNCASGVAGCREWPRTRAPRWPNEALFAPLHSDSASGTGAGEASIDIFLTSRPHGRTTLGTEGALMWPILRSSDVDALIGLDRACRDSG